MVGSDLFMDIRRLFRRLLCDVNMFALVLIVHIFLLYLLKDALLVQLLLV